MGRKPLTFPLGKALNAMVHKVQPRPPRPPPSMFISIAHLLLITKCRSWLVSAGLRMVRRDALATAATMTTAMVVAALSQSVAVTDGWCVCVYASVHL